MSLEELEARMIHQGAGDPGVARLMAQHQQQQQQAKQAVPKAEEEMLAFKRLVPSSARTNTEMSLTPLSFSACTSVWWTCDRRKRTRAPKSTANEYTRG